MYLLFVPDLSGEAAQNYRTTAAAERGEDGRKEDVKRDGQRSHIGIWNFGILPAASQACKLYTPLHETHFPFMFNPPIQTAPRQTTPVTIELILEVVLFTQWNIWTAGTVLTSYPLRSIGCAVQLCSAYRNVILMYFSFDFAVPA